MAPELTETLARDFARRLRDVCGAAALVEMDRRNRDDYPDGACASHDFCDANIVMAATLEAYLDLAPGSLELDDSTIPLWDGAWNHAAQAGFARLAGI